MNVLSPLEGITSYAGPVLLWGQVFLMSGASLMLRAIPAAHDRIVVETVSGPASLLPGTHVNHRRPNSAFNFAASSVEQLLYPMVSFVEKFDHCGVDLVRAFQVTEMPTRSDLYIVAVRNGIGRFRAQVRRAHEIIQEGDAAAGHRDRPQVAGGQPTRVWYWRRIRRRWF